MSTKISVITSVLNGVSEIGRTIESIINQSYDNFEYIIINDGSSDNTQEVLKHYVNRDKRIKIINNPGNIGLTKSLNKALKIAEEKYIARIDAGDIAAVDRLARQVAFLESNPEYGIVGSSCIVIFPELNTFRVIYPSVEHKEIVKKLMLRNIFYHSSLMIRKNVFCKTGQFEYKFAQDYDLLLKTLQFYKLGNLHEILCIRVQHLASITTKNWRVQEFIALKSKLKLFCEIDTDSFKKSLVIINFPINMIRFFIPTGFKVWYNRKFGKPLPSTFRFDNLDDYYKLLSRVMRQ